MRRHIGFALRTIREEREMTQRELARLTGMAPSSISLVEQGKSGSWRLVERIVDTLGVDDTAVLERAARLASL